MTTTRVARSRGAFTSLLALTSLASAQGALQPPPAPAANPTTPAKAVLGKILFFEEQLSVDGTVACATCHIPGAGGADPRLDTALHPGPDGVYLTPDDIFGSAGIARTDAAAHFRHDAVFGTSAQATPRTSPSNLTGAYFPELFWDGRTGGVFEDPLTGAVVIPAGGALEAQSLEPLRNTVEMAREGETWADLTARVAAAEPLALASDLPADVALALNADPTYPGLFGAAFGTPDVTPVRIAFALAAYQRTLVPNEAKFDRVMRGQAVFTAQEQQGFGAFQSPGSRCAACHTPPLFSDLGFHNLGLRPIAEDDGRRSVTGNPADRGRFKTPSLRNVGLRSRFFHNGAPAIDGLPGVLGFYDADGGAFGANKDPLLAGLNVPPPVRPAMLAFLATLTDPRVAAETYPFDRPTLRSERATPNPEPLGTGVVPGAGLLIPAMLAGAPAAVGHSGFRLGLANARPNSFATVGVRFVTAPAGTPVRDYLHLFRNVAATDADGVATWSAGAITDPALRGVAFEAQWLVRDPGSFGGVAKSELVRVTLE